MTKTDPHLNEIIHFLKTKYKCHTAILYGSRARGEPARVSDYDVVRVIKRGSKTRIAKLMECTGILISRIQKLVQRPFKPDTQYEIDVTIAWAEKQLDRLAQNDVQGL